MNALFLTPSLSRNLGGIFEIERSLAHALGDLGVKVDAAGLMDEHWPADEPSWLPLCPAAFPIKGPAGFGYSSELAAHVLASEADILHLHALWMYPSVLARKWGNLRKRPYLVTPNGMLEPWALANSRWKKRIAAAFYERGMLNGAGCLQANTVKELEDFRAYGLKNPVAVIPNGVSLPDDRVAVATVGGGPKILLFLGRLHPKKGLVNALSAWKAAMGNPANGDWRLVIAGWDQGGHEAELTGICDQLGLDHAKVPAAEFLKGQNDSGNPSVVFLGPAFGAAKEALFLKSSAFILPSFSEGLPMSVLEAWSYRLPVLMTDACNLSEGFEEDAAIRIGTDVKSISNGLGRLFESTAEDLGIMGRRGRALVERKFTWQKVAEQMKEVYEWMTSGGSKPGTMG